jgi:hypothetical protein
MAGRGRREVAAELAAAGERFARWRRGRVRGARIPRELWQLAIELADRYGVSRVSGWSKSVNTSYRSNVSFRQACIFSNSARFSGVWGIG